MAYVKEILCAKLEENEQEGRRIQLELGVLSEELSGASAERAKTINSLKEVLEMDYQALLQNCRELRMAMVILEGQTSRHYKHK